MGKLTKKQVEEMIEEMQRNPYWQKTQNDKIPRCFICGEKYKKVKPYLWKSNCPHIPKHLLLAFG
jgi:hypothetical protein